MTPHGFLTFLCTELVGQDYRLHASYGDGTCLLELFGKGMACGRLTGRQHRMILALRALAEAVGRKHGIRVYLTLDQE